MMVMRFICPSSRLAQLPSRSPQYPNEAFVDYITLAAAYPERRGKARERTSVDLTEVNTRDRPGARGTGSTKREVLDGAGLSPRPLVSLAWRMGLRVRARLWGRLRIELRQRHPQRIKPRRVRKPVRLDDAPNCRGNSSELVVGEVNCRRRPDIIGRNLSSKEAFVRERRLSPAAG
jgi:hypothetical protein